MTEYILAQAGTILLFVGFILFLARRAAGRHHEFVDSILHSRKMAMERFERDAALWAASTPHLDVAADLAPALAKLAAVPPSPDPNILRDITDEAIKRLNESVSVSLTANDSAEAAELLDLLRSEQIAILHPGTHIVAIQINGTIFTMTINVPSEPAQFREALRVISTPEADRLLFTESPSQEG